jgi:hypothetical protein
VHINVEKTPTIRQGPHWCGDKSSTGQLINHNIPIFSKWICPSADSLDEKGTSHPHGTFGRKAEQFFDAIPFMFLIPFLQWWQCLCVYSFLKCLSFSIVFDVFKGWALPFKGGRILANQHSSFGCC